MFVQNTANGFTWKKWHKPEIMGERSKKYHPGGFFEMRSLPVEIDGKKHANQCIYKENGDLIIDVPAAGSADLRASPYPSSLSTLKHINDPNKRAITLQHVFHDVWTYELAARLDGVWDVDEIPKGTELPHIEKYFTVRPVVYED